LVRPSKEKKAENASESEKMSEVTIPEKEYNDLIEDQKFLNALRAAGVDNWDGYDYAFEILEENA
jgi:hypothetical protein